MVQITQNMYENGGALIWSVRKLAVHLVKKFGTAPKQNLTESLFFEISSSNSEHNLFRFMALNLDQF